MFERDARLPKFSFIIKRNSVENSIDATGAMHIGGYRAAFDLDGYSPPEVNGIVTMNFRLKFSSLLPEMNFDGKLDVEERTIRGTWTSSDLNGDFVFKREVDLIRYYRPPALFHGDPSGYRPGRIRWEYAKTWVQYTVRRKLWSKQFFLDRLEAKNRYIDLSIRVYHFGKALTLPEQVEMQTLHRFLDPADVRLYTSLINARILRTSTHMYVNPLLQGLPI